MGSYRSKKSKPLFTLFVVLLLVLQPAFAVPTSRSMQMRNQQHPPSVNLLSMKEMEAASRKHQQGSARAERMVVEVNDYPSPGPNHRHDIPPPHHPPSHHPPPHHPPMGPRRG
ncbi:unnamed protein product [Alopecurus aequalis]